MREAGGACVAGLGAAPRLNVTRNGHKTALVTLRSLYVVNVTGKIRATAGVTLRTLYVVNVTREVFTRERVTL